ncbi:ABC transporter permease [Clostridium thermosuccinogenes]|jgi:multiple sugar transport system permease protein/putative aldouronate transport system permease protein|uniref:ABC transporter permease n=1 Tax=Clostridium thermosuccinogenes TaxID=84032 RepID=A0A2K2FC23_9CLOT|nr:carbohydrate ABC transporter permease [Pseudoclostridium thermosuccinogenes]AUS96700.1 ABC transporter permease [Pseudoclostridium thermosuccinogenes]PNT96314.1 ABC transporter permease [Pseudoclostridium thermosuccinogenes]PNT97527.1 ABC transporter permease [Pseudoclostridium thermosuccinogenes]
MEPVAENKRGLMPGGVAKRRFKLSAGDIIFSILNYIFFTLFTLICVFPFYYLFINTISDNELVRTGQIKWYPVGIHFNNYISLVNVNSLGTSVLVSVGRTILGTSFMVAASAFVGYLVTKKEMWGRRFIYRLFIVTMYFNAGLIPWYMNMSMLGLTNNFWGYVIPGIVAPFNIILVKTYIESIPSELEESAFIDGAGYLTIFTRIIWPLSKPILATIAIFGAVGHWNSFTDSMILMSGKPELYTLQYRLYIYLTSTSNLSALMNSGGSVNTSVLNSVLNARTVKLTVAMVTILPILLVYPFMQRYFIKGIMIGAVKG